MLADAITGYITNNVGYARYKVGDVYHAAVIENVTVLTDGRISISFIIDHTIAGEITVTEVQLFDVNDVLWISKTESITRANAHEGILYRFNITVDAS